MREGYQPLGIRRRSHKGLYFIWWIVVAEYEPGAFEFGLWFGLALPVDTSGAPDQVVPYVSGQGEYRAAHSQTAPEYVAVRAFRQPDQPGPRFRTLLGLGHRRPRQPAGPVCDSLKSRPRRRNPLISCHSVHFPLDIRAGSHMLYLVLSLTVIRRFRGAWERP